MSSEFYRVLLITNYCPYLKDLASQEKLSKPGGDCWELEVSNAYRRTGQLECGIGGKHVNAKEPHHQSYEIGQSFRISIYCGGCMFFSKGFEITGEVDPPLAYNPEAPPIRR